jgi:hypothetical protein
MSQDQEIEGKEKKRKGQGPNKSALRRNFFTYDVAEHKLLQLHYKEAY